jgi:hypothetical protein
MLLRPRTYKEVKNTKIEIEPIEEEIIEYIQQDECKSVSHLAKYFARSRQAFTDALKEYSSLPLNTDFYNYLKTILEVKILDLGFRQDTNAMSWKFWMINMFDWSDKKNLDIQGQPITIVYGKKDDNPPKASV